MTDDLPRTLTRRDASQRVDIARAGMASAHQIETEIQRLRFEARLAYLDDRIKRARDLNRKADKLAKLLREKPLAEAHDYPRLIERLGPIEPCRTPRDHVHVWTPARNIDNGLFCRECGQWKDEHDAGQ